jgi:hypothetical protein
VETKTPLAFAIAAALAAVPLVRIRAADQITDQGPVSPPTGASTYSRALASQLPRQGDMLVFELRQARGEGLRADPWGMTDSLQEARRLVEAIAEAERLKPRSHVLGFGALPLASPPPGLTSPLDQRLDVDLPLSQGRLQRLGTLDYPLGLIRLHRVYRDITRALHALQTRPPALGRALLATADALNGIDWKHGLEPRDWAVARDQILVGYALAIDGRSGIRRPLRLAQAQLSHLPGAKPYALQLAALLAAPAPQPRALGTLVEELDAKVQALRDAAEKADAGADKGAH